MKRFQTIVLTAALSLGTVAGVHAAAKESAEEPAYTAAESQTEAIKTDLYQLGDQIENFTVTLTDGTQVDLYDLLKEKKAVLINLFASWCRPCMKEFPELEKAYTEMQDEIGVLALSVEPKDTLSILAELKESLGLKSLPMGRDESGLYERISNDDAKPYSVLVDRNGTICFIKKGSLDNADQFKRVFSAFTAEPYETRLLETVPESAYTGTTPIGEELKAALCPDLEASFTDPESSVWPFLPAEEGVSASNGSAEDTEAIMKMTLMADAGNKLGYQVKTDGSVVYDNIRVDLDGTPVNLHTGNTGWQDAYITFPESGEHEITFTYKKSSAGEIDDTQALIRNIRLISEEEASAIDAAKPDYPISLEGSQIHLEVLSDLEDIVYDAPEIEKDYGKADKMRALDDNEYIVRILVGPDVNVDQAYVTDITPNTYGTAHILRNLPQDEKGFLLVKKDITEKDFGTDPYGVIRAASSAAEKEPEMNGFPVFLNEDSLKEFAKQMFSGYTAGSQGEDDGWHIEKNYYSRYYPLINGDGSSSSETEDTAITPEDSNPAEEMTYSAVVTDEKGNPIEGVMVQACNDDLCQVAVTDAEGKCSITSAPTAWQLHILKAPEGYRIPNEVFDVNQDGKAVQITLKAEE